MERDAIQGALRSPRGQPTAELMVLAAIIFDGIKGGVGKSWIARLFAYVLQHQNVPWTGVDGDPNNGHLVRFHPTATTQADATSDAGFDVVLDAMGQQSQDILLLDLPAGAGARLAAQMPALRAASEAAGMRIIRVFVMEPTFDSANQFAATIGVIHPRDTLIVLNNRSGKHDAFSFWKGTRTRADFLQSGGTEALIGKLDDKVVGFFEINPTGRKLNFFDALASTDLPGSVRFRLSPYLYEVVTELQRVFNSMGLVR